VAKLASNINSNGARKCFSRNTNPFISLGRVSDKFFDTVNHHVTQPVELSLTDNCNPEQE
jgi:hypothetical protein